MNSRLLGFDIKITGKQSEISMIYETYLVIFCEKSAMHGDINNS